MKARKRPVVVDVVFAANDGVIQTLEGWLAYKAGDAIITGVRGECYPCQRDIFDETYEIVEP